MATLADDRPDYPDPGTDTADDRPSGLLAVVAGMVYMAILLGFLFGVGLLLGAIRWGF